MDTVQLNLWGDSFGISDKAKTKELLKKISSPKKSKKKELSAEKLIKSKTTPLEERLSLIRETVNRELGRYKNNTQVIYNKQDLIDYINKAISNGIISIDTETIGTRTDIEKPATDPLTCKLAGPCLYTPGLKSAYIPINHTDLNGERLSNQLTEEYIHDQLKLLVDNKVKVIYHNAKFDYKVLWYTCGVRVPIYWDTMIASQILNENEPAGLKYQYSDKIDPSIGEYHIDTFFNPDDYAFVDPETFSLYAATDAYETFLLYEHQKKEFEKPGNEKMYNTLFKGTEMPDVTHIAEMEMWGMNVDKEFADRLSKKFHIKLDEVDKKIDMEMSKYKDIITQWRSTEEANFKGKNYIDLKSVDSSDIKSKKWDGKDEKGYYKYNKSLSEKLADPIELTSPTQLGILLYDVLKVLKVGKDKKKVVDEATLLGIEDKLSLVNLILKKREYEKYLGTYIDALPKLVNPRDGRLHAKINQLGREEKNVVTGRMSSSDPNLQNIPARGDIVSVRCMFTPSIFYNEYEKDFKNIYEIPIEEECLMSDGSYKWVSELEYGDVLDTGEKVISIGRSTGDRLIRVGVE